MEILKIVTERRNFKTMGHITVSIDNYSMDGYLGDPDLLLWYVILTKVKSITLH